jgi:hypothetical protein
LSYQRLKVNYAPTFLSVKFVICSQSSPGIHVTSVLLRYFIRWKLQVNIHKIEAIFFTRRCPVPPAPLLFQHTVIPWNSQARYLGLLLDPKFLFTRHLTSVTHKATGIFLQFFLSSHAIQIYPFLIRSLCTNYLSAMYSRFPCLEQHIILQLPPSANFTVQISRRHWQLPQAHPHPTSSYRLKGRTY